MVIFFCDIVKTFTDSSKREENFKEFAELLSKIIDKEKTDYLEFSFLSLEDYENVKTFVLEFSQYITDPRVILGYQFSKNKKFKLGEKPIDNSNHKFSQIIKASSVNNNIEKIYYASDIMLYHIILNQIYDRAKNKSDKLIQFAPGTDYQSIDDFYTSTKEGLSGLNICINKYCESKVKKISP